MWPDYGDVEAMTEAGEQALAELYDVLLAVWAPAQYRHVLPEIAGETLPPVFDAFTTRTAIAQWETLVDNWIVPAMTFIWSWAYARAMDGFGTPLDPGGLTAAGRRRPDLVADLVALAFNTSPEQMKLAALMVADDARNSAKLQRFLGEWRPMAESFPARLRDLLVGSAQTATKKKTSLTVTDLRDELGSWLGQVYDMTGPQRVTKQKIYSRATGEWSGEYVAAPRKQATLTLFKPFRDLAAQQGLQAAGIINQATLIAASQSEIDFDVVWIARIDEHTRPAHFAADGQRQPLGGSFRVGGVELDYPGDPSGPPGQVINCRCRVGMVNVGDPMPLEQRRTKAQRAEIDRRREAGIVRAREDPDGLGYITPMPDTQLTASGELDERTDMGNEDTAAETAAADAAGGESFRTFTDAVLALIGVSTSDNRILAGDIDLSFRQFPLPLMWMRHTGSGEAGHTEAFTVGVIEDARVEDDKVLGSGYMLNTPEADEACQQVSHGVTGPSVDLASVQWAMTDADGNQITEEEWWDLPADAQVFQTLSAAELIGTTLVPKPAFGATMLTLNGERESRDIAIVAGAAERFRPRVYPARFFADPALNGPTLPTMDDDGHIFGHVACFGACHRGIQADCIMAPRSRSNYSHFHTSPAVRLDDGSSMPVGRLTVGTGHAPDHLAGGPAAAHYDNTGSCWALVRVGEDAHGVWFSGVVAPWATPEQIEMGLSAPLSGDWRDYGQGLELTAVLSVNTPGFPTARGRDDDQGRPVTLVASLGPAPTSPRGGTEHLTITDIKSAVAEAMREQTEAQQTAARRAELLARARTAVGVPPSPAERIRALLAERV